MLSFQQFFLESIRGEDMFHIVSGPLQAGKSTFCKKLATKFGVTTIHEFTDGKREGIDVTKDDWWHPIISYGAHKGTTVIETHMSVNNVYPWDKNWKAKPIIDDIKQPPALVQIYFVIPRDYDSYNRRSEELLKWPQLVKVYDYYSELSKHFPTAKIIR